MFNCRFFQWFYQAGQFLMACLCVVPSVYGQRQASAKDFSGVRATIPFEMMHGIPVVSLTVNGHHQAHFIVDTGCPNTVINADQADALGVKVSSTPIGTIDGTGENPALRAYSTNKLKLSFGDTRLAKGTFRAISLQDISSFFREPIGGILCYDFLRRQSFVVDFPNRRLELGTNASDLSSTVPYADLISTASGLPIILMTATVAGRRIDSAKILLDTGSDRELSLNRALVGEQKLIDIGGWKDSEGAGLNGRHRMLHGHSGSISNEMIELPIRDVALSNADTGNTTGNQPEDGFLGSGTLSAYALFFDVTNKRVFFSNNSAAIQP
ncbi:MAG: aspartyl protease family protein [Edaphobacter sp.]